MSVRRVAYRLLNLFPPNQFKFKIFWVDSDAHVRAMFELHRRYGSREVMELLTEMETVNVDAAGPSSSSRGGPGAIIAAPIRIATSEGGEGGDDDSDGKITNQSIGDVPLVIKPIQPFQVLRISLSGCGRLIPRSAASGCTTKS
ncbi:hypothetical protein PIB30_086271 [Stylosanthes scabra]|uniref:Uncharacterized protein n=1 Tax=Stylosanthes scabra TaxID=79078 RepID=A0ABU6QSK8_9FABA|nr:hypothetical protein [Stylosanthes scabra]